MRVYVVRKWPLRGRSRFVCWNITRVSLWLQCNVYFVESTQRTRLQTRPFVCGINNLLKQGVCASTKHPCWRVCGKNLNIVSMCVVSPVVHTSNISSCQKKKEKLFHFSCGCEQFHKVRSFDFHVTNFVITENIMKRPVCVCVCVCYKTVLIFVMKNKVRWR